MNILNTLAQMSYFSNMCLDIFGGRKHENFKIIIFYSAKELWKPRDQRYCHLGKTCSSELLLNCPAPAGTAHSLGLSLDSVCLYRPAMQYFWHRLN